MKNADRAKTVQRPCKWRIKRKSHEESCDSSWDFGALEGTRIPGPLIKSQMLYRLSYERIFCGKTIPPNNITTIGCKKQEQRSKKRKIRLYTKNHSKNLCARRCSSSKMAFLSRRRAKSSRRFMGTTAIGAHLLLGWPSTIRSAARATCPCRERARARSCSCSSWHSRWMAALRFSPSAFATP